VLSKGDIGFAEGYISGAWQHVRPDRRADPAGQQPQRARPGDLRPLVGRLVNRLRHLMNANTLEGSRRNIARHYDLGNDFYALWLDPSMTYSSARFDGDSGLSLQARRPASTSACSTCWTCLPRRSLLEIGCGWGGFAEHAARTSKHRVRGITLSRNSSTTPAPASARPG
jgi:cyclopropane-fatty-acyl-phospholipid synthase